MSRILQILFNTEMVQAILDGRKTVTRRIVKKKAGKRTYAPYQPGDILYVRETWNYVYDIGDNDQIIEGTGRYIYYADDAMPCTCWVDGKTGEYKDHMPWRPSIHMTREAARIWLRVKDVKAQQINDMTLDDFLKEGVVIRPEAFNDPDNAYLQAKDIFKKIWDSTQKGPEKENYMWEKNPYVWVIGFERCEKPSPCILKGMEPAEYKIPCIGYGRAEKDDEPCEMCKKCLICSAYEEE